MLGLTLLFFLLQMATFQSVADETTPSLDIATYSLATSLPPSPTPIATKYATPAALLALQPSAAVTTTRILIATPTAGAGTLQAPLPTSSVQSVVPLTTTSQLQNRVAISVAAVAQALLTSLHMPMDETPSALAAFAPMAPLTTTSGALPPLVISEMELAPPQTPTKTDSSAVDAPAVETAPSLVLTDEPPLSNVAPLQSQWDGTLRKAHVPILMYHYLSDAPTDADIYRRDLSVSPTLFAAHLDRIAAEGYAVIPLTDLINFLLQGTPLPAKAVVITFDDGYRDNYENAFPLLHERGITATFFVVMEFINRERPEYLTWSMVQEMAAGGMSIEAHGVDHTSLRGRSRVDLEFQALRSYETLQNAIGQRAHFISYPAGEYDDQTIDVFQNAGYLAGVTTAQGATEQSDDLFRLPRVRIRGTTTPDELARLLALDW